MQVQPIKTPTANVPQTGSDAAEAARQALAAMVSGGNLELLTLVEQASAAAPRSRALPNAPELAEPLIEFDGDSMALLLQRLQHQTANLQESTAMECIKLNQVKLKTTNDKHLAKLKDAQEAQAKAEADAAKSWWGRLISTIGGALLAFSAAFLAVATAVASFGASVPLSVYVLAMAIVPLLDSISDVINICREPKPPLEWAPTTMLTKGLVQAFSTMCNKELANLLGSIFSAVAMIALAVGSGYAAAKLVKRTTELAKETGTVIGKLEQLGANTQFWTRIVEGCVTVVSAGGQCWSAGWNMARAGNQLDADLAQADALDIKKVLAKLQQVLQEEQEGIAKIIEALEDSDLAIVRIISSNEKSRQQITYNMA